MRFGLRAALLLQVALPLLAVFALLLHSGMTLFERVAERRLQQEIQLVARAIQLPVGAAMERGDLTQVRASLDAVFEIGQVYGAYLFDADGQPLSVRGVVEPAPITGRRLADLVASGQHSGRYERIDGRSVYSYFVPLFDIAGNPSGLLQITRRRSDFYAEFHVMEIWAWSLFGGVAVLVVIGLLLTHERAIGRHVTALLGTMQAVEQGGRGRRAPVQGPAELADLASALNRMLDAIHRAGQRLRRQHHERRRLTQRLRETETMAALGELAAGVAHELGAPLSVVDGRARRLQQSLADHGEKQRELSDIRAQVQRMSATVRQLLAFGHERPGRRARLSVSDWVQRAVAGESADSRVRVDPGPELVLYGDPLRLEQALANLLRNALQAAPDQQVEIQWQCIGSELMLTVDDAGPGIAPELRERLFAPFFTTRASGQGSGLGLAIVASVMREHGGQVHVDESPLGGARFRVTLPLQETGTQERSDV